MSVETVPEDRDGLKKGFPVPPLAEQAEGL
jgi:hypothetical protein